MRIPKALKHIARFCDSMCTNYALGAVLVGRSSKKPFAVATDGRRMAHVTWDEGVLEEFQDEPAGGQLSSLLVPGDAFKEMAALCNGSKKSERQRFHLDENDPKVLAKFSHKQTAREFRTAPIEGRFPKWQDVLPKGEPVAKFRISAALLADTLAGIVGVLECKGSDGITIEVFPDSEGVPNFVVIRGKQNDRELVAVQMLVDQESA